MHLQKSKKSIIYLFLLIIFGSINNINLKNIELTKIKSVNVSGLEKKENIILSNEIKNLGLENIFSIDNSKIKKIIERNSLVEKYNVFKIYPSSVSIYLTKTQFLAKINVDGDINILGSNGKLLNNYITDYKLPFIFGKPDIQNFLIFKEIFEQSNFEFNQIKNLYFFPSRRWDVEFHNNKILKLPENIDLELLNYFFDFMKNENFNDVKIFDARIKNKIILNG